MAALALSGCGGGSSLLLPGDGVANHISITAGNNQSGRVGEPLTDPLVAEVTDSRGRPVQGVTVAFAFTSAAPGAEINPSTATTDAKGEATAAVILGTTIGAQTGEASIVTDAAGAPSTAFTLMAVPRDANGIAVASGDDQSGKVGAKLGQPLVVQVTDAFGNPISGVPIDWTAQSGGSVSDASTTTDGNGLASVERTLGPAAGKQTTTASSQGLAGSPLTFTHTATAGSASTLTIVSGNNQTAKAGTKLPSDLVVQLLDGDGNGVPSTAVTWVVAIGGGSVTPENGTTDDQGVATAQWTLGPNPGPNRVDAVVSGVGVANFSATGTAAAPSTVTTTTTITGDSPDPSVSASPFTVDVRVTSPGPVPPGTVQVTADGAQANCTVTLQNGSGSCSLTLTRVGDRTLRATYSGAAGFKASSATAAHKVVAPQQQNRPPHADYNWTCNGLSCQFTDHSSDPDGDGTLATWSWTFGDGGTSQDRNPAHTFPAASRYEVALTVTDNAGGSNTATAHVDVKGPPPPQNKAPHAEFDVQCADLTCSFTDRSRDDDGSVTGWNWNFGDGQSSGEQNPSHQYAAPSRYTVTLTATDNGGATDFKSHDANPSAAPPPPNQNPTAAFTPSCTNLDCNFTDQSSDPDGSIASRSWTFGDGGTSNETNPSHPYATAGTYTVTLTVTDDRGAQGSASRSVTVAPANQAPTAAFNAPSCVAGTPCPFTDGSNDPDGMVTGWLWDFGDGTSSNEQNPSHAYASSGTPTVTLTVTDNSGAQSAPVQHTVTVAAASIPPNAVIGSISCTGLSCTYTDASTPNGSATLAQWSWVFGDGASSNLQNATHDYAAAGNYDVTLTVTDNGGLTGTAQETISVSESSQNAVVRTRAHS